ncbi:MAG: hypothetical protein K2K37_07510 [Muribaculaceae bacterium]|nr:hypothetical protein [Muribaculaceae bacterium]
MKVTITVELTSVFDRVARTTGYAGAKLLGSDADAYDRISTTEADEGMLRTLWRESRDRVCHALRHLIDSEGLEGDTYRMDLNLSEAFDVALIPSVAGSLEAYFVNAVIAGWMNLADKAKAAEYTAAASQMLSDLQQKVLCKRPPRRPNYSTSASGS